MTKKKRILFLEGYYGGSHRAFADGWRARSRHEILIEGLPARKWKWRMKTAAWIFARRAVELDPDLIFATDMLNLAELYGMTRMALGRTPSLLYFHENQYSYPEQSASGLPQYDWGAINSASALVADGLIFNSEFHKRDFFRCWRRGNRVMPDARLDAEEIDALEKRVRVIPVGVDFDFLDSHEPRETAPPEAAPLILWNHRWEHDKGPDLFFDALRAVRQRGVEFRLAVCGESFGSRPECFERAREEFANEIVAFGFLESAEDYARLLWEADIVVSTSIQEFLGISVVEALWCGCRPLLPERLNYPYLLPKEQHEACLFRKDGDLARKLEKTIIEVARGAAPYAPRQAFLRPYGWRAVAERLDDLAETFVAGGAVSI